MEATIMNNPCIISIFMKNIDMETVSNQQKVVSKYNQSRYKHYSVLSEASPGYTMDMLIKMAIQNGHDAFMFLDVDCVPLNKTALDEMFDYAKNGFLVGDAQRSNHIDNNQHVFCAPHNITFSLDTWRKIKEPSFSPTYRGDVAEELTYAAEEFGVPLKIFMPKRFDFPPIRMAWEDTGEKFWRLADGMPVYGVGTTFGTDESDMFYHHYQIFHPGQQEIFNAKCNDILGGISP
jgi:hypothetical protein